MNLTAALLDLRLRDWTALGILIGVIMGFAEALAWLLVQNLGVPQMLWAAPLVDCTLSVVLLLIGALLARAFQRPAICWISAYISCLMLYAPLRVVFSEPKWKLPVMGCVIVLAFPFAYELVRLAVSRRTLYLKSALVGVGVVLILVCATEIRLDGFEAVSSASTATGYKNVLIIVVDTLRADHLSLAGFPRDTTPHLDHFAAGGAIFDTAISASSWTLPAHASLLTGRYPREHRTTLARDRLPKDIPIVSEWFSQHGYRTAAFSGNPLFFSRRTGFGRGFEVFEDTYPPLASLLLSTVAGQQWRIMAHRTHLSSNLLGRSSAEDINRQSLAWIERDARPFFAVLNYFDVHDPYVPPPQYRNRYGAVRFRLGAVGTSFNEFPQLTDAQEQQEIAMYDAAISYTDDQIHLLLSELEQRGILRNTVVVITSDHGEEFTEHGFSTHANALYTELIHVPLIIVAPGEVPPATRIATPVSLTHIPATVIDLATGQNSHDYLQRSLATLWRDPKTNSDWPPAISELAKLDTCEYFPNYSQSFRSVTTGEWHYIVGSKGGEELFRVSSDPTNAVNLASSTSPDVIAGLRKMLESATQ